MQPKAFSILIYNVEMCQTVAQTQQLQLVLAPTRQIPAQNKRGASSQPNILPYSLVLNGCRSHFCPFDKCKPE